MAKPGPRPQTDAQKRLKGETRPSRLSDVSKAGGIVVEFPIVDQTPAPPDWMINHGKELWNEIAPLLFQQKVLTKADLAALTHLCQQHGEIIRDYLRGVDVIPSRTAQLKAYFAEFGLTPSSRTRVPHGSKEGGNRFGNNGKKQAQDV